VYTADSLVLAKTTLGNIRAQDSTKDDNDDDDDKTIIIIIMQIPFTVHPAPSRFEV
jgi:hypothetical protein